MDAELYLTTHDSHESRSHMRLLTFAVATLITAAAVATTALADTSTIRVADNYFVREKPSSPTVLVSQGDTLTWTFEGRSPHNVTVRMGPERFRSRSMTSGDYERTLTRPGWYRIYCTIHGLREMSMTLKVSAEPPA